MSHGPKTTHEKKSWHRYFKNLQKIKHGLKFPSGNQQKYCKRKSWGKKSRIWIRHHREFEKTELLFYRREGREMKRLLSSDDSKQNSILNFTFAYITGRLTYTCPPGQISQEDCWFLSIFSGLPNIWAKLFYVDQTDQGRQGKSRQRKTKTSVSPQLILLSF